MSATECTICPLWLDTDDAKWIDDKPHCEECAAEIEDLAEDE